MSKLTRAQRNALVAAMDFGLCYVCPMWEKRNHSLTRFRGATIRVLVGRGLLQEEEGQHYIGRIPHNVHARLTDTGKQLAQERARKDSDD